LNGAAFENRLAALEEAMILFMALSTTPPEAYTMEEYTRAQNRLKEVSEFIQKGIEMRTRRAA
jgi:hypothetical protein